MNFRAEPYILEMDEPRKRTCIPKTLPYAKTLREDLDADLDRITASQNDVFYRRHDEIKVEHMVH